MLNQNYVRLIGAQHIGLGMIWDANSYWIDEPNVYEKE
jgi:hypothetical protein